MHVNVEEEKLDGPPSMYMGDDDSIESPPSHMNMNMNMDTASKNMHGSTSPEREREREERRRRERERAQVKHSSRRRQRTEQRQQQGVDWQNKVDKEMAQLKRLKALLRQHKTETKQQQQRLRAEREAWQVSHSHHMGESYGRKSYERNILFCSPT